MTYLLVAAAVLRLAVSPLVSHEPSRITARVSIPPDASNREACLAIYLEGFQYKLSCWTLNGLNETPQFTRVFDRLPTGAYTALLSVQTTSGITSKSTPFEVQ